ncbi:MAG: phosphotransferase [Candidatus Hodarchaeota archaeon]
MEEDYEKGELIGRGVHSEILYWGEGKVVKLYNPGFEQKWITLELEGTKAVSEILDLAPKTYGLVEYNGRTGLLLDFIEGEPLGFNYNMDKGNPEKYTSLMAEMQVKINGTCCDGLELGSYLDLCKGVFQNGYGAVKPDKLTEDFVKRILDYIDTLPDDDALVHGDFTMDNVIMAEDGPKIIDWAFPSLGHPAIDSAKLVNDLRFKQARDERFPLEVTDPPFIELYLKHLQKFQNVPREIVDKYIPLHCVPYLMVIGEAPAREWLISQVEKYIK